MDGRAHVTNKMVELLVIENQKDLLINLICIPLYSKATRPEFIHEEKQEYSNKIKQAFGNMADGGGKVKFKPSTQERLKEAAGQSMEDLNVLEFIEIVKIAIDLHQKSTWIEKLLSKFRERV